MLCVPVAVAVQLERERERERERALEREVVQYMCMCDVHVHGVQAHNFLVRNHWPLKSDDVSYRGGHQRTESHQQQTKCMQGLIT